MYGAIEAGGTKFVVAIGNKEGTILKKETIPTDHPDITMPKVLGFFKGENIKALGLGGFGPIDTNKTNSTYGQLLQTPKQDWVNYPLGKELRKALHVPVEIETDVNVAAMSEALYGHAQDVQSCVYITVGTGIGAGIYYRGKIFKGLSHPELGHMRVKKHPEDSFAGVCPYHQDCLEGLASGPALEKRWGKTARKLADDPFVWEVEAYYLAQAITNISYILAPERIILGGGVMHQTQLFPLIRKKVMKMLNGYTSSPYLTEKNMVDYIKPPGLGDEAGIRGALSLVI